MAGFLSLRFIYSRRKEDPDLGTERKKDLEEQTTRICATEDSVSVTTAFHKRTNAGRNHMKTERTKTKRKETC